ncbi:MAG: alkaline phosphatase family protein, partial [Pararhodobacter sp.]|nr:alkaline phosphatase family protein [Pararhodobacter sp.]
MTRKLLLIVLDGVPYANWRRYFGCLEGWVKSGEARVWRMRASLPSMSGPCYASIHTGVPPQEHGVLTNAHIHRVQKPDVFGQVRKADGVTGAVTHSWWSEFFNRAPFDMARDIEYDEPESDSINHGRFHTMTAYDHNNQATPCDADLFATLTSLCARYDLTYGILHTCTLDSMGHRFGHDCAQMDHACAVMDAMLAGFLPSWHEMGYEVIVTADHGQSLRGHHGGTGDDQQDFA